MLLIEVFMLVVDVDKDEHNEFVLRFDSDEAFEDVLRLWWRRWAKGASKTSFNCIANKPFKMK